VCPSCSWLVLAPKVLQLHTNHLVLVLCRPMWVNEACQFFLVPSWSSSTPLYPSKVLWARERASTPCSSAIFCLGLTFESLKELGVHQLIMLFFELLENFHINIHNLWPMGVTAYYTSPICPKFTTCALLTNCSCHKDNQEHYHYYLFFYYHALVSWSLNHQLQAHLESQPFNNVFHMHSTPCILTFIFSH